jgi:hypothetical protein
MNLDGNYKGIIFLKPCSWKLETHWKYWGSPTSTVSTSTISTSTNFRAIGIKLVLVEFLPDRYVVKLVLVEIGYVIPH